MSTGHTARTYAELIEQARSWRADMYGEGMWFNAMADWMERAHTALTEIAEGRGPFSNDQLTFATNTIECMKEKARAALYPQSDENQLGVKP